MADCCIYCGGIRPTVKCSVCDMPLHAKCVKAHFEYWNDEPDTHDVSIPCIDPEVSNES